MNSEKMEVSYCKEVGLIYPSSEIYGGFEGFYDYGPLGTLIKNNLQQTLLKHLVRKRQDVVPLNSSIICNPITWKASGHADRFSDTILVTKDTRQKTRADHFVKEQTGINTEGMTAEQLLSLIKEHNLKYADEEITNVYDLNTMFRTSVGDRVDEVVYLRPETCQSIFTNFRNVISTNRVKLPFGIFQIGKAFRNEISPRNFIFRCREFEQAELEYFYDPEEVHRVDFSEFKDLTIRFLSANIQERGSDELIPVTVEKLRQSCPEINVYHAYWIFFYYRLLTLIFGLNPERLRVREHLKRELSHYSCATVDIEFQYPFGFKELMGIANRSNYDLIQHETFSKKELSLFGRVRGNGERIIPEVIEPSIGLERLFFAIIVNGLTTNGKFTILKIAYCLAPYKVAVLPLKQNHDDIVRLTEKIYSDLIDHDIEAYLDIMGSIGKKYARQDEIGTPFCLTVDFQSLEDNTVTIRDRNTTNQSRLRIQHLSWMIPDLIAGLAVL